VPLIVVGIWAFTEVWRYPSVLPQKFGLRFWHDTLARADVWVALTTSLALATTVTAISAVICLPAAYAFARLDFPGRNALFLSFLSVHAFPKFGLIVSIAAIFLGLHLIGTFWGVVLIQLVGTLMFMIWIPAAAFQGIDRRLEEAARDVGANPLQVFFNITLPQAAPTIAAAVLLSFVGTFYETEGAWLIGAPQMQTAPPPPRRMRAVPSSRESISCMRASIATSSAQRSTTRPALNRSRLYISSARPPRSRSRSSRTSRSAFRSRLSSRGAGTA